MDCATGPIARKRIENVLLARHNHDVSEAVLYMNGANTPPRSLCHFRQSHGVALTRGSMPLVSVEARATSKSYIR